jgi:hypothetical protein
MVTESEDVVVLCEVTGLSDEQADKVARTTATKQGTMIFFMSVMVVWIISFSSEVTPPPLPLKWGEHPTAGQGRRSLHQ